MLAIATALAAVFGGAVGGIVGRHSTEEPAPTTVSLGGTPTASRPVAERPAGSIAAVASRILPSVVSIEVRTSSGGDTGSGIVISDDGYILTNNHVVAPAVGSGAKLHIVFSDKNDVVGTIVGRDTVADLAVVRVRGVRGLQAATLGSSASVAVGDTVVAVGSPLGLAGTVTSGIVSALDRPVSAGAADGGTDEVIDAIQTDAAINPGNSGGPLVNAAGEVIGVNSAIATLSAGQLFDTGQGGNIGLGFAIPIDQAKRIARQLIEQGFSTHAIIGVSLDGRFSGDGAKIGNPASGEAVVSGGPADRAGLRDGDIIVSVNGVRITSVEELIVEIRKRVPGQKLTVAFLRDGDRETVTVVLGSARSD